MTTDTLPTTSRRYVEVEGRPLITREDGQVLIACTRCGGRGTMEEYRGINGGTCFECYGSCGTWATVKDATATYRRRDADKRRRDAARAKKAEKVARDADALMAEHPELAGLTDLDVVNEHRILMDLRDCLIRTGKLSPKQVELAARLLAEQADRKANLAAKKAAEKAAEQPAPAGRITVTGTIATVRDQEGYAYDTIDWKMLVLADGGFKVWATIPRSLFEDDACREAGYPGLKGHRVEFVATLEPKADDPAFAIGKRPAKARVLDA
jgi:hypothetical protein